MSAVASDFLFKFCAKIGLINYPISSGPCTMVWAVLHYAGTEANHFILLRVGSGKWEMPPNSRFVAGTKLTVWGVLDLVQVPQAQQEGFVNDLYNEGAKCGVEIDFPIHRSCGVLDDRRDDYVPKVVKHFKDLVEDIKKTKGECEQE
jgi:hypothetical protein